MPAYTRGKKRPELKFVPVNLQLLYGFKPKDISSLTGVSASDVTALGHITASAAAAISARVRVVGANAPKPHRVTKRIETATAGTQQSVSTFCGFNNLAAAQAAKWSLTRPSRAVILRAPSANKGSLTAIAKLSDGSLYCFSMNKADFDTHGAALGLESAATITTASERAKLVSGSSLPKPGKASIEVSGGGSFSSFYSSDQVDSLATAGYSILTQEVVIAAVPPPAGS